MESGASKEAGLDLLWGARAIANELGIAPRKAYHALDLKLIPAKKVGNQWVASKQGLRAHFKDILGGAA